ncbi:MAG: ammonium transporter [Akkermansiaceae bacterium]|nr:ammonium transporter [Akkermansiaceae bacterium]
MTKTTRYSMKTVLMGLIFSMIAGFGTASAAQDYATLIAQAEEFAKATEEAGDDEDKAPSWDTYVTDDADTAWATITDAIGDEEAGEANSELMTSASPEAIQAIYDNVWANTKALTPWLVHNIWVLIAAFLVFLMHLGFCSLESGLCQKKNVVNILFKNCWIIATGILTYYFWGFNAHYPGFAEDSAGFFAAGSVASYGPSELLLMATNLYHPSYTWWTDFIFQAMFAATAATIVSGAVAERVKLTSFMIFAVILVGIAYPWVGSWHWGGGWLSGLSNGGFYDFAGSTVVHAFGGFAALACVMVLGARKGKYTAEGTKPILGHSMPLATIGVFLLFFGWFGFNGGSVLAAEPHLVSLVIVATSLAAVGGAIGAIATGWICLKKPDLSMALNGFLAGLVGITAGPDVISPTWSIVVGLIAGVLVVFSILFFDKIKIDDPVGAISVHGVCGIWGTLAVGIFSADHSIVTQLIGCVSVCAFAFVFSYAVFYALKVTMGVRVDEEEEYEGLDVAEHGSPAYTG